MEKQQINHEKQMSQVLERMEDINEEFTSMKRLVNVADEQAKEVTEKMGREAIEETKYKVFGSARQFMQTAAVALKDHFEQEHEKQKNVLLDKIRDGALKMMQSELTKNLKSISGI